MGYPDAAKGGRHCWVGRAERDKKNLEAKKGRTRRRETISGITGIRKANGGLLTKMGGKI